jgi:hypothetical protein
VTIAGGPMPLIQSQKSHISISLMSDWSQEATSDSPGGRRAHRLYTRRHHGSLGAMLEVGYHASQLV